MIKLYTNMEGNLLASDQTDNIVLVETEDGSGIKVYRRGQLLDTVGLGTSRIFRPDHDAMFVSDNGRVWLPQD